MSRSVEDVRDLLKWTFDECIDNACTLYSSGKVDETTIEMFVDSTWILSRSLYNDWTIDFGFGKKLKATSDYFSDTVKQWIMEYVSSDISLSDEIEDVEGAIKNEELWLKGSISEEDISLHSSNLKDLKAYHQWLTDRTNAQ